MALEETEITEKTEERDGLTQEAMELEEEVDPTPSGEELTTEVAEATPMS